MAVVGAAAISLSFASTASAQVDTDFNYTLTGADPVLAEHYHNGCTLHATSNNNYQTRPITITVSGTYSMEDRYATGDASAAIISGSFNPASPATGCVLSIDDGPVSGPVSAGNYTLVLSTLGDGPGTYGIRLNGPAAVVATSPTPVPTLSEWAMILFGTILAGGAALYIQRRRLIA
ncbi:IPTL-CTERM sorting domain-containing protein [Brevundimonas sp.]|uniref:IPTL-CTERM sorting domain-containing protein n=1 Tax=Brevundimonas sp. TaxID=1871086 RepID=UPI002616BAE4|nr:IPTL-CTERM sorting domain-containing protein [Brevundimonas sp.]